MALDTFCLIEEKGFANIVEVDYNSWVESEKGLKLAASLPKDTVLAEGTIHFGSRGFSHANIT